MKKNKLKFKLNTYLIVGIVTASLISGYIIKELVVSFSISNTVTQAKQMTNQLLVVRSYLASVAFTVEESNSTNIFSLTPAYVGAHIGNEMSKKHAFYIKQTSLDYRNHSNAPDEYEKRLINKYENGEINGEYWKVDKFNGEDALRYSVPLYIEKDCMKCHGKPYVDVDPIMYENIVRVYGNKSFNYKVGDLRGAISVAIPMSYVYEQNDTLFKIILFFTVMFIFLYIFYLFIENKFVSQPMVNDILAHEEYQEIVIESNNSAIIAIDWSGKITTYNKKAQEIFGWSKEEMIGQRNVLKIVPDKYKELHTNAVKKYLSTGKSCGIIDSSHELEAIRKDGTIFPIQISFGAKYKINNAIVIANIEDITKRKELEGELLQLNKELDNRVQEEVEKNRIKEQQLIQQSRLAQMGELISMIAHQWRQPLSAISSTAIDINMKLLLDKYDLEDKQQREDFKGYLGNSLKSIDEFVQNLSKTIDDFRNFYKPDKESQDVEINDVIKKVLNIIKVSFNSSHIEIVEEYNSNKLITVFEGELIQVILNIFKNAQDNFLEKDTIKPTIHLKTYDEEDKVIIEMSDNGGGISDEIIDKVFDPYFSTKDEMNGTGLGLYMSKIIIEEHHKGKLYVENRDVGASFIIELNG